MRSDANAGVLRAPQQFTYVRHARHDYERILRDWTCRRCGGRWTDREMHHADILYQECVIRRAKGQTT